MYMYATEVCEHWETIQDNQAGHQTYLILCQYQASECYEIKPTSNQECFGRYTNVKR
jgi:hypothetical protein